MSSRSNSSGSRSKMEQQIPSQHIGSTDILEGTHQHHSTINTTNNNGHLINVSAVQLLHANTANHSAGMIINTSIGIDARSRRVPKKKQVLTETKEFGGGNNNNNNNNNNNHINNVFLGSHEASSAATESDGMSSRHRQSQQQQHQGQYHHYLHQLTNTNNGAITEEESAVVIFPVHSQRALVSTGNYRKTKGNNGDDDAIVVIPNQKTQNDDGVKLDDHNNNNNNNNVRNDEKNMMNSNIAAGAGVGASLPPVLPRIFLRSAFTNSVQPVSGSKTEQNSTRVIRGVVRSISKIINSAIPFSAPGVDADRQEKKKAEAKNVKAAGKNELHRQLLQLQQSPSDVGKNELNTSNYHHQQQHFATGSPLSKPTLSPLQVVKKSKFVVDAEPVNHTMEGGSQQQQQNTVHSTKLGQSKNLQDDDDENHNENENIQKYSSFHRLVDPELVANKRNAKNAMFISLGDPNNKNKKKKAGRTDFGSGQVTDTDKNNQNNNNNNNNHNSNDGLSNVNKSFASSASPLAAVSQKKQKKQNVIASLLVVDSACDHDRIDQWLNANNKMTPSGSFSFLKPSQCFTSNVVAPRIINVALSNTAVVPASVSAENNHNNNNNFNNTDDHTNNNNNNNTSNTGDNNHHTNTNNFSIPKNILTVEQQEAFDFAQYVSAIDFTENSHGAVTTSNNNNNNNNNNHHISNLFNGSVGVSPTMAMKNSNNNLINSNKNNNNNNNNSNINLTLFELLESQSIFFGSSPRNNLLQQFIIPFVATFKFASLQFFNDNNNNNDDDVARHRKHQQTISNWKQILQTFGSILGPQILSSVNNNNNIGLGSDAFPPSSRHSAILTAVHSVGPLMRNTEVSAFLVSALLNQQQQQPPPQQFLESNIAKAKFQQTAGDEFNLETPNTLGKAAKEAANFNVSDVVPNSINIAIPVASPAKPVKDESTLLLRQAFDLFCEGLVTETNHEINVIGNNNNNNNNNNINANANQRDTTVSGNIDKARRSGAAPPQKDFEPQQQAKGFLHIPGSPRRVSSVQDFNPFVPQHHSASMSNIHENIANSLATTASSPIHHHQNAAMMNNNNNNNNTKNQIAAAVMSLPGLPLQVLAPVTSAAASWNSVKQQYVSLMASKNFHQQQQNQQSTGMIAKSIIDDLLHQEDRLTKRSKVATDLLFSVFVAASSATALEQQETNVTSSTMRKFSSRATEQSESASNSLVHVSRKHRLLSALNLARSPTNVLDNTLQTNNNINETEPNSALLVNNQKQQQSAPKQPDAVNTLSPANQEGNDNNNNNNNNNNNSNRSSSNVHSVPAIIALSACYAFSSCSTNNLFILPDANHDNNSRTSLLYSLLASASQYNHSLWLQNTNHNNNNNNIKSDVGKISHQHLFETAQLKKPNNAAILELDDPVLNGIVETGSPTLISAFLDSSPTVFADSFFATSARYAGMFQPVAQLGQGAYGVAYLVIYKESEKFVQDKSTLLLRRSTASRASEKEVEDNAAGTHLATSPSGASSPNALATGDRVSQSPSHAQMNANNKQQQNGINSISAADNSGAFFGQLPSGSVNKLTPPTTIFMNNNNNPSLPSGYLGAAASSASCVLRPFTSLLKPRKIIPLTGPSGGVSGAAATTATITLNIKDKLTGATVPKQIRREDVYVCKVEKLPDPEAVKLKSKMKARLERPAWDSDFEEDEDREIPPALLAASAKPGDKNNSSPRANNNNNNNNNNPRSQREESKKKAERALVFAKKAQDDENKKRILAAEACRIRLERMQNEAHILSNVAHPNIVGYVDYYFDKKANQQLLFLEYVDGGDLFKEIERRSQQQPRRYFSIDSVTQIFVQTVLAVEYLHRHNILHRDIKSQNLLVSKHFFVKLTDFGTSRQFDFDVDGIVDERCCGTPLYLAAELVARKPYSQKSDMWSLGVLLFELLSFRYPFDGATMKDLTNSIQFRSPLPLRRPGAPVPQELLNLTFRLLHKDPDLRPTAKQVLAEFGIIRNALQYYEHRFTQFAKSNHATRADQIWLGILREHIKVVLEEDQCISSQRSRRESSINRGSAARERSHMSMPHAVSMRVSMTNSVAGSAMRNYHYANSPNASRTKLSRNASQVGQSRNQGLSHGPNQVFSASNVNNNNFSSQLRVKDDDDDE